MKYGYIYKSTNLINNKIYIGQKKGNFNPTYFGSGTLLRRALLKHGTENFKIEFLVYAKDKEELNSLNEQMVLQKTSLYAVKLPWERERN